MTGVESSTPELLVDNQSAIGLSKNPVLSKHSDVLYHYIHEYVEERRIASRYTESLEQLADMLTKVLGRVRFLDLRSKIGVRLVEIRGRNVVNHSHDPTP
jgi:hypothetical protein